MTLLQTTSHKILSRTQLAAQVQQRRRTGEQAVFTNGCFDLLHLGHVRYLQEARNLGDFLILGLNSDTSVRTLKGPLRPLVNEQERAEIMGALTCIDYITIFSEPTAGPLIDLLQPEIYVKGADYAHTATSGGTPQTQVDTSRLPEAAHVYAYGGKIQLLPYLPGHSTTELIQKIKRTF